MGQYRLTLLISLITLLIASNCFAGFVYDGEGVFSDAGPMASNDRYILDLGKVDLSSSSEKTVLIGDLPNVETLGLYLYFDTERIAILDFWRCFSKVKIHITITDIEDRDVVYEYKGVLFEESVSSGTYSRKGINPVETTFRGARKVGFTIPYYFDEKKRFMGIETPFYKNHKRRIVISVLEPLNKNDIETVFNNATGPVADFIISGGDW